MEVIRFGFIAKTERSKQKLPHTRRELGNALRQGTLVLCHAGPSEMGDMVLEHVRENLDSLPNWTVYSTEDHDRAKKAPQQIVVDLLPGRLPVTRE